MNSDMVFELLFVSMWASVISTQLIQKIKNIFKFGKMFNNIISLFISFIIGFGYSYSFYSEKLTYCLWIGLFTLVGAENLYKIFNKKYGINIENKIK